MSILITELKRSKYRLLGLVGQGQFGRVYCASHRKTGRLVALKDLDRARFPTHKFLRELRFLLSLQHTNIVTCHALEHAGKGRYLVMDYCEGGTLRSLMEEDVQLHPTQSLKLVADILTGLNHAHSKGIIHCDIKPENILLSVQSTGWIARISDFGISRLIQEIISEGNGNTGSPAYMAPERFYGQYSHSSDLYAVGILLFELLAGYRPFSGSPFELMSAHLNRPISIPDTIPPSLQAVILTALQKLQARRFNSAAKMLEALQSAATTEGLHWSSAPINLPLLHSTATLPTYPFKPCRQENLRVPLSQLSIATEAQVSAKSRRDGEVAHSVEPGAEVSLLAQTDRVYWATGNQVGCQFYRQSILTINTPQPASEIHAATVRLPEPVVELLVRPQGCFVITSRSIYVLPDRLFSLLAVRQHEDAQAFLLRQAASQLASPQPLTQFNHCFLSAISPNGRWLATATADTITEGRVLSFWSVPNAKPIQSFTCKTPHLFRLLALDDRHFAALFHTSPNSEHLRVGTSVQIFTRRGRWIGSLNLPVSLKQVVVSTKPYRLVATEAGNSTSLLLIDLKPLRITRVAVDLVPRLITATSWGYLLMNAQGQIVILDSYGQQLGQIEGPASPTAIAPVGSHGLMISTWKDEQGGLYTVDLKEAEIDLLF